MPNSESKSFVIQRHIENAGGDLGAGVNSFLSQNAGEGWLLPETLRLADYGLGHDHRAKEHQPVASRLGPRYFDWQTAQDADESWRECRLHARNLLGEEGFQELLRGQAGPSAPATQGNSHVVERRTRSRKEQQDLFE